MTISQKTNRRVFLKRGTLVATAATALPYFVPRHALGMSGTPGANEQIVVGFVGMGVRGRGLIGNIPAPSKINYWSGSLQTPPPFFGPPFGKTQATLLLTYSRSEY